MAKTNIVTVEVEIAFACLASLETVVQKTFVHLRDVDLMAAVLLVSLVEVYRWLLVKYVFVNCLGWDRRVRAILVEVKLAVEMAIAHLSVRQHPIVNALEASLAPHAIPLAMAFAPEIVAFIPIYAVTLRSQLLFAMMWELASTAMYLVKKVGVALLTAASVTVWNVKYLIMSAYNQVFVSMEHANLFLVINLMAQSVSANCGALATMVLVSLASLLRRHHPKNQLLNLILLYPILFS